MKRKEKTTDSESRNARRSHSELKTIVQVKESEEETWKEVTRVTTVSRNGAGFSLSRECTPGRLVTLVLPMPTELRAYDQDREVYPVMGLVQYCNKGMIDGEKRYHVGVGFIGKHIPASFKANPLQSYRIVGMTKEGLWTVTEAETPFKARRHPRFWLALDVTVTLLQREKKTVNKENAVTQNIGASGVSVVCSLDASIGEKVKFACKSLDFYALAIVRNRKEKEGQPATLHLEFIENMFPVEKILLAQDESDSAQAEDHIPDSAFPPPAQPPSDVTAFEFS